MLVFTVLNSSCHSQNQTNMKEQNNPLLCDPAVGMCEIPNNLSATADRISEQSNVKPIKIIYFTDPICSSCWGIEPQLRKLKLEYGNAIEIEYRMGGLLPDWSYNSGGISKPSDVAHHWDEVSIYYDMPIDGDLWLEDPLSSSYPPSIAFKAAQIQDPEKAHLFLRELKEMVFLHKKNISKWENLQVAAQKVGLDVEQLKIDFEGKAKLLFQEDLKLAKEFGVRGFPTLFFLDTAGNKQTVYGSKPYAAYENTLIQLHPTVTKTTYDSSWKAIFTKFKTLTAREFSELSGMQRTESEKFLNELTAVGKLKKFTTKNGAIWTLIP